MQHQRELQQIADELRSIAAFGLNFAQNPNDDARYHAVLSASARLSALLTGESSSETLTPIPGKCVSAECFAQCRGRRRAR